MCVCSSRNVAERKMSIYHLPLHHVRLCASCAVLQGPGPALRHGVAACGAKSANVALSAAEKGPWCTDRAGGICAWLSGYCGGDIIDPECCRGASNYQDGRIVTSAYRGSFLDDCRAIYVELPLCGLRP